MGRHKLLVNDDLIHSIESDLREIKDSDLLIKLLAIRASYYHKETEVAAMFNVARSTLSRWIVNYKNNGIQGCINKSKGHNPSKLSQEEKDKIKEWVITSKDNSGKQVHWTLKRLIKEIAEEFNKEITKTPLWLTLISLNLSLKKPRPQHYKSDEVKQADFKKNSRNY